MDIAAQFSNDFQITIILFGTTFARKKYLLGRHFFLFNVRFKNEKVPYLRNVKKLELLTGWLKTSFELLKTR